MRCGQPDVKNSSRIRPRERARRARDSRPPWLICVPEIRVCVWKLDRLGRSLRHLIEVVNDLHRRQISFRSLQEAMDTSTPGGQLIFHVFGALAEFERELIRERTQAGLTAARDRGRFGGRPRVMTAQTLRMARQLLADLHQSINEVCKILQVSRATLYRYLKE